MATTTMRLGLLFIFALAIIQISKAELENEDERQIEQKPEGSMMASSMEEVELRNVREVGNKNPGRKPKKRKSKNAKKKKRQNKKKARRKGRKGKSVRRKKKGAKKTRKNKSKKKGGKKKKKSGSKKRRVKKKKEKDLKKKKRTKKFGKKTRGSVSVKQTCDEAKLCQKIKDYIKYSNQLRKVKRIVKSCETMEKKANKSATEFDATVAALDTVIASNAKRRLYIRWRRTQRSTDEVVAIRDNLKNCSVSAKAKCERKVEPACGETALHTECEAALQDWVNKFGPSKGSCLQANADCCACITALAEVDAKCLDFDTKSNNAVKSKKKCTGTDTGSFGFCRKQQQEASVKGPPAACGGGSSSATKAPSSGTTAAATAAGATTAKPQDSAEKIGDTMESFFTSKLKEYITLEITSFEAKIEWLQEDFDKHVSNNINISHDIISEDQHISAKILKVWDILKNSTSQSQVDEELDKLKKDENEENTDGICFCLIEAARGISKIVKSETTELNGLHELWKAVVANTEKDNVACSNCTNLDLHFHVYQNTTLGAIAGFKEQMGLTNCINGTLTGMMIGLRSFISTMHYHAPNTSCLPHEECQGHCFSGTSQVETMSGPKNISELIIGDFVKTSSGAVRTHFTEFLGWMGRQKSASCEMLQVFTSQGHSSLTLSGNHIVFTSNATKYADQLQPGDFLVYFNGSVLLEEMVTNIQKTFANGSWAPLTKAGTLLVDGYLVSCYASFPHWPSDLAFTPVKIMPKIFLDDEESQHKDGSRSVVKMLKTIGEWSGLRGRNLKTNEVPLPSIDDRIQPSPPIIKSEL